MLRLSRGKFHYLHCFALFCLSIAFFCLIPCIMIEQNFLLFPVVVYCVYELFPMLSNLKSLSSLVMLLDTGLVLKTLPSLHLDFFGFGFLVQCNCK